MNFKKLFSITLSVILISLLFSACQKPNSPTIENTSSVQEEEKITLAETIEKTEAEAVYKIGEKININATNADIKVAEGIAHIFFDMGDTTEVVSLSVYENLVLSNVTVSGNSLNYGVLDGGQFYAVNLDTATLFVYEKSGELKSEKKICDSSLRFGVLNMSGQYLIYQKTDSAVINRYDLLSDDIKESEEEFNITGIPSRDKTAAYVKDSSGKHFKIDFENFGIIKTRTEAFKEYVDCMGVAVEGKYFTVTDLYNGSEKRMFQRLGEEQIIAAQTEKFITLNETKRHFRLYDISSGVATGEIEAPGNDLESIGGILDAQFVGDEYILLALKDKETAENYYRLFNIKENQDKVTFEYGRINESEIYKKVFGEKETEAETLAKTITEKYNIRFLYGNVGKDFKTDFKYTNADGVDVLPKLKVVEKVFEVLPAELLMEATADREIWVYFCSELDNKDTEYSDLAVLTELYNHKLILIDSRCSDNRFAEMLCHEFAHILDDYMPQSVKNGFSKITPEDIKAAAYTNDYKKLPSDQYTPYDSDKDNVWFYNNYCRINEKEDRVITLGEMFKIYAVQSSGENFAYENVKKKAGYLTHALEVTFDYCKETDKQHWELAFPYSE